jgi:ArsR family transcriptional regulator, lead/cadmium/zinc/bismuth-responsive transcriptional repressor
MIAKEELDRVSSTPNPEACCLTKPDLGDRPLLSLEQAGDLEGLFKVLANDTRLRLLHALAKGEELSVSGLAEVMGMKAQAVSNQLQRLLDGGILTCKRDGNSRLYRIANSCVTSLLDRGLCLMEEEGQPRGRRFSKEEA